MEELDGGREERFLFPLATPKTMSNQSLNRKAGKYWVIFLERVTLIAFPQMSPALAIHDTWELAYARLGGCSAGAQQTCRTAAIRMYGARCRLEIDLTIVDYVVGSYNIAPTCTTGMCGWASPFLRYIQCTDIFFTPVSSGGECESPVRKLKPGVFTGLVAGLILILPRWPPAPPDLERPKHALEGGHAHSFSSKESELWLML